MGSTRRPRVRRRADEKHSQWERPDGHECDAERHDNHSQRDMPDDQWHAEYDSQWDQRDGHECDAKRHDKHPDSPWEHPDGHECDAMRHDKHSDSQWDQRDGHECGHTHDSQWKHPDGHECDAKRHDMHSQWAHPVDQWHECDAERHDMHSQWGQPYGHDKPVVKEELEDPGAEQRKRPTRIGGVLAWSRLQIGARQSGASARISGAKSNGSRRSGASAYGSRTSM